MSRMWFICCFADYSTYSVAHEDHVSLSAKLKNKYSVMVNYLTYNLLNLNDDKTHLLVEEEDSIETHCGYQNPKRAYSSI